MDQKRRVKQGVSPMAPEEATAIESDPVAPAPKREIAPFLVLSPRKVAIFKILWAGRAWIVAGTLITALVAGVVAYLLPETYEATAPMILLPTPIKQDHDAVSALIPRVLSISDYEILLQSDGVLKQTAERVKQTCKWPQSALDALDEISEMRSRTDVDILITEKTLNGVMRSPVIVLRARGGTAEQARDLAQAWAQVSEEFATKLYKQGKSGMKEFVESRFENARTGLDEVEGKIRDMEISFNDELEKTRMAKKHERLISYEEKRTDLKMKIEAAEKELADLRAKFDAEPEKKTLWKSPPMTAIFLKDSATTKPASAENPQESGYKEEIMNETWLYLKQKMILAENELISMKEHERQLAEQMDELEKDLQVLRQEIATKGYERRVLDLQERPMKHSFDLLSDKLEQAKIAESEQTNMPDIKIVADAVLPDKKIRPMRSLIVAMAMMLGFVGSCGMVFTRAVLLPALA